MRMRHRWAAAKQWLLSKKAAWRNRKAVERGRRLRAIRRRAAPDVRSVRLLSIAETFDQATRKHLKRSIVIEAATTYRDRLIHQRIASYLGYIALLSLIAGTSAWLSAHNMLPSLQQVIDRLEPTLNHPFHTLLQIDHVFPQLHVTIQPLIITVVVIAVLMIAPIIIGEAMGDEPSGSVLIGWFSMLFIVCGVVALSPPSQFVVLRAIQASAAGGSAMLAVVFLSLPLLTLVTAVFERRRMKARPDVVVITRLLRASYRAANMNRAISLAARASLLQHLEEVAVTLERYWWRRIKTGDIATDIYFRTTCARWSAAIRELHFWVLSPQPDTPQFLSARLQRTLFAVTSGNLDMLWQTDPRHVSTPSRLRNLAISLITALLPASAFVMLIRLGLPMPSALLPWVALGVYGWTILALLFIADPSLSAKITMLKDLRSLFPGAKTA